MRLQAERWAWALGLRAFPLGGIALGGVASTSSQSGESRLVVVAEEHLEEEDEEEKMTRLRQRLAPCPHRVHGAGAAEGPRGMHT